MLITADDLHLFNEGTHFKLYEKMGAHFVEGGVEFSLWAPNAEAVSVTGEFNGWQKSPMTPLGSSGIWHAFIADLKPGQLYKYHIRSKHQGYEVMKADPMGFYHETPPQTASRLWQLDFKWSDQEWMKTRQTRQALNQPLAIFELHLGSWRRKPDGTSYSYRELAPLLVESVREMNYTHVEFMPIMEHPFYGSWGYQLTGYYAPTSRYGTPQDLMYLIDELHRHGIGVILDWVPSHFPNDEHGLGFFDSTHLYEHSDPRKGFHPDWNSLIFNYGRKEVQCFLISNALYWLDRYHVDGIRVDAVASMLYLDYSRKEGEWIPNEYGGRENLEAISFLKTLNTEVYKNFPDVHMIAEESTAFPGVSHPTYNGGLGFGMKWDMGWMHDTLEFLKLDPVHRKYHHDKLTFRSVYAFSENFVLSLSHDEVVHGKGSLFNKMPGDEWQKEANVRLLMGYMYTLPGKKLLFMGMDSGQRSEWSHEAQVENSSATLKNWVRDLQRLYREQPALYQIDFDPSGFEWVSGNAEENVLIYLRKGSDPQDCVLVACNFTPVPRPSYKVRVPYAGPWQELLNSDAVTYGGSGLGNLGQVEAFQKGHETQVEILLPPLAVVLFKPQPKGGLQC